MLAPMALPTPDKVSPFPWDNNCRYASLAISHNTRLTFSTGQKRQLSFCAVCAWNPLPVVDMQLSIFTAHLAGRIRSGTICVYLSAVRNLCLDLSLEDPIDKATLLPRVLKGICMNTTSGPTWPRLPITLCRMVDSLLHLSKPHLGRFMLHVVMLFTFHG